MPGWSMPADLQRRIEGRRKPKRRVVEKAPDSAESSVVDPAPLTAENYVALEVRTSRKGGRNLLPAFNASEWVVVPLDGDDNKENNDGTSGAALSVWHRQEQAARRRELVLRARVATAIKMSSPPSKARRAPGTRLLTLETKLDAAASKKALVIHDRVIRARELARLRTPRKKSRKAGRFLRSRFPWRKEASVREECERRHAGADERRAAQLVSRARRAAQLGNGSFCAQRLRERRQFKLDELTARLQAAEERRAEGLRARSSRAAAMSSGAGQRASEGRRKLLREVLAYKMEAAAVRRTATLQARAARARQLGDGNVNMWLARKAQFMADVLSARLEEASDRRRALLDSRARMARAMSGDAVAQFLRLEASMMRQALTNLWRLKLEAASARRNIFLNQRKRRAYELGDEIVRVTRFEKEAHAALRLSSKLMEADGRREKFLDQVRARAGLLGEGGAPQRKRERLSKKAQALLKRIEAAEAKRKSVLASKAMRASKLGSERVERSRYKMTMENAIQDCARVCRIRAAEERRYKNLTFVQNAAARSNARAAAIAGFVEERNRFEREIGQRHIAYKMARAEMNRDVQKLLSRGLHDPTFTLVKPIAFMC